MSSRDRRSSAYFHVDIQQQTEQIGTSDRSNSLGTRIDNRDGDPENTENNQAAHRWSDVYPTLQAGLEELVAWANGTEDADEAAIERSLNGIVASVVAQFAGDIGLWTSAPT